MASVNASPNLGGVDFNDENVTLETALKAKRIKKTAACPLQCRVLGNFIQKPTDKCI